MESKLLKVDTFCSHGMFPCTDPDCQGVGGRAENILVIKVFHRGPYRPPSRGGPYEYFILLFSRVGGPDRDPPMVLLD